MDGIPHLFFSFRAVLHQSVEINRMPGRSSDKMSNRGGSSGAAVAMRSVAPLPVLRLVFYLFIFAIPIETLDVGIEAGLLSLSSLVGYLLVCAALLQPGVSFKTFPEPLWCFLMYLFAFVCLGMLQDPAYTSYTVKRVFTLTQMFVLFWICHNLFQHEKLVKEGFIALGAGCVLLSILQLTEGGTAGSIGQGRVAALSQDANTLGSVLGLGLIALLGLAYGRTSQDGRMGLLAWICFGSLAAGIVLTGSRGAFLSLMAGIFALMVRPGLSTQRIKVAFIALSAAAFLMAASYASDTMRARWDRTFSKGSMAGREKILPVAWQMFTEAPMLGWGAGRLTSELGRRFGRDSVDTHNGYLWVLTETGVVGSLPYLVGLWLCLRAAWRGRHSAEGSLPLAMLTCVLVVNMSLTWHSRKLFWMVLAYSVASESILTSRLRQIASPGRFESPTVPVGYGLQPR